MTNPETLELARFGPLVMVLDVTIDAAAIIETELGEPLLRIEVPLDLP